MFLLIAVSLLWAFSFGLIRVGFKGIDPLFLALLRLALASLVFCPFFRWRIGEHSQLRLRLALLALGAIQYGLMYALLFAAYPFVGERSYLIAIFTVTTPIYVLLIASLLEQKAVGKAWFSVALAVLGALVLRWDSDLGNQFWIAFFLLQGSNLAFAFGQVAYRRHRRQLRIGLSDAHAYAWIFLGAMLLAAVAYLVENLYLQGFGSLKDHFWLQLSNLDASQWWTLLYLGTIASGLAFFAWNRGATQVSAPQLAVLNNLKIPLAVLVSLAVFGEWREARWLNLIGGGALIAVALAIVARGRFEATSDT